MRSFGLFFLFYNFGNVCIWDLLERLLEKNATDHLSGKIAKLLLRRIHSVQKVGKDKVAALHARLPGMQLQGKASTAWEKGEME